ncbi:TPA: Nuclear cap-binding protein subunit 1 [Trebouxia sp. C0004]
MGDRQNGGVRGRGAGGRGRTRMRMDDPAFIPGKRKREEEGDPVLHLLSLVLRIGDRLRKDTRPVEEEIDEVAKRTRRDVASRPDQVIQTILDCSVEVATKCGIYATLVGLWHADEEIIVTALLNKACEGLNEALTTGDRYRARLLLRLLAALTTTNVVSMQSMFSMLNSMVTAAMQALEQGDKAEASRRLQPYTDYLVYSAVIALPWLAPELQHLESDPEGLTTFSSSVEQYLGVRPRAAQDALNPFPVANEDKNAASLGDGGGASFLPQLWQYTLELKENHWNLLGVPSYSQFFEAQLAACKPLELPELTVPLHPPGVAPSLPLPEAAAAVLKAYPSRGALDLQLCVNKQLVTSLISGIDRIVAQEYVIDTIHYFDGDNNELARRLGIALPFPDIPDPKILAAVVQETIFSQLLRLPESELGVLAYAKVTTNLCKLSADFAQPIGGCLKALKEGMGSTDPDIALCVAEWLALHINNHDFIWSWHRWENVLDLQPYDPIRHFVAMALERTMRLSFREFHLQFDPTLRRERVPEAMFELLGPTPSARPVFEGPPKTAAANPEAPVAMDAAEPQPHGQAADVADAPAQAPDDPAQAAAVANADAAVATQAQGDELEPVPDLAQELFAQVKRIQAPKAAHRGDALPQGPSLSERLSTWLQDSSVRERIGGDLVLLKWLSRCLLTIGGRSIGHLYSYLDRHEPIMNELTVSTGDQGEDLLMDEATSMWANSVQHTSIIVDHLMGKHWVSGAAVLRWLFGTKAIGMRSADDAMECLKCTDILNNTVARVLARTQDDKEIVQAVEQELHQRQTALQALEPNADPVDGDQGMNEDSPALMVGRLQPEL